MQVAKEVQLKTKVQVHSQTGFSRIWWDRRTLWSWMEFQRYLLAGGIYIVAADLGASKMLGFYFLICQVLLSYYGFIFGLFWPVSASLRPNSYVACFQWVFIWILVFILYVFKRNCIISIHNVRMCYPNELLWQGNQFVSRGIRCRNFVRPVGLH